MKKKGGYRLEDYLMMICGLILMGLILLWALTGCSTSQVAGTIQCEHEDSAVVDLRMECRNPGIEKKPPTQQGEDEG